jgi:hypothetical protein
MSLSHRTAQSCSEGRDSYRSRRSPNLRKARAVRSRLRSYNYYRRGNRRHSRCNRCWCRWRRTLRRSRWGSPLRTSSSDRNPEKRLEKRPGHIPSHSGRYKLESHLRSRCSRRRWRTMHRQRRLRNLRSGSRGSESPRLLRR